MSLLLPLTQACDPEPEQPPPPVEVLGKIGTRYLEYLAAVNDVNRFHCGCRAAAGDFASVDECFAFVGGPVVPPLLADCYARVFDGFDEARDHIECQATRHDTLLECLTNAGCSAEPNACQQEAGAAACPNRPYEVEAALAETCLGYTLPAPFVCGDGTKILPWLECDFAVNCPDGSDEYADCPGAFACKGGEFISQQWVCDGFSDCSEGDDEADCEQED